LSNWNDIWRSRDTSSSIEGSPLRKLMLMNGYDSATGNLDEKDWQKWVLHLAAKHNIERGTSVFEVGCGAGAFLYPLHEQGARVAGSDISKTLIDYAHGVFTSSDFEIAEAKDLPTSPAYDVVLSMGVFLYFPNLEYASNVFKRMIEKARYSVSILDIPNIQNRDATEAKRRKLVGIKEYEKKYSGLQHLYYSKNWFVEQAAAVGVSIELNDQNLTGYNNSDGRFNVFLEKT